MPKTSTNKILKKTQRQCIKNVATAVNLTLIVVGMAKTEEGFITYFRHAGLTGFSSAKQISHHQSSTSGQMNNNEPDFYQILLNITMTNKQSSREGLIFNYVIFDLAEDLEKEANRNACVERIKPHFQTSNDQVFYDTVADESQIAEKLKLILADLVAKTGFAETKAQFIQIIRQDFHHMLSRVGQRHVPADDNDSWVSIIAKENPTLDKNNQKIIPTADEQFQESIKVLRLKATDLKLRGYKELATQTSDLATTLDNHYQDYKNQAIDYKTFANQCQRAIDPVKHELKNHRNCKWILANIGLAILGLGVGYALWCKFYNKKNTGSYWFFNKTDSCKKVEAVEASLKEMNKKL